MREGWSRLNPAQRMLFGFWMPSLVVGCLVGGVGCFFLGDGWVAAILVVIAMVGAVSLVMTIRDGARRWPGPRS